MNQSRLDRLTSTFDAGALICTLSCRVDGREYYFTLRDPGHAYTRIFLSESLWRGQRSRSVRIFSTLSLTTRSSSQEEDFRSWMNVRKFTRRSDPWNKTNRSLLKKKKEVSLYEICAKKNSLKFCLKITKNKNRNSLYEICAK